jgi:hypothetical protein
LMRVHCAAGVVGGRSGRATGSSSCAVEGAGDGVQDGRSTLIRSTGGASHNRGDESRR